MIGTNTRVADLVYAQLRDEILSGRLRPGERLPQVGLAERFETSQTPVREALARLERDGLVQLRPRRGAEVVQLTASDVLEIYEMRQLLEPYAVKQTARLATDDHLARIRELAEVSTVDADLHEIFELNRRFHRALYEEAGNTRLLETFDSLWSSVVAVRMFDVYASHRDEQLATLAQEHQAIAAALEARDGNRAAELVREHIEAARGELLDVVDEDEE